ncbi:MAG: CDP-alcohol phosphatidyltransferase family protein [Agathobacter sp.]|nr:CDP-alcohol phosphatidyltransferase family protein [Agathobacter sp.]
MERKRIGYYDYTVVLTYCGMLLAFTGVLMSINGKYWNAVLCLMLAGVCDMFDGAVAATKERDRMAKNFGIQIDSLSDLVSFGVLPAIIVYMISGKNPLAGAIAAAYTLCALIRLAYFNVLEEERQKQTTESRKSYLGVPVTTIAIFLPAFYVLFDEKIIKNIAWLLALLAVTAIGFITPVNIKKPKIVGKICIVVVGIVEAIAMVLVLAWGAM